MVFGRHGHPMLGWLHTHATPSPTHRVFTCALIPPALQAPKRGGDVAWTVDLDAVSVGESLPPFSPPWCGCVWELHWCSCCHAMWQCCSGTWGVIGTLPPPLPPSPVDFNHVRLLWGWLGACLTCSPTPTPSPPPSNHRFTRQPPGTGDTSASPEPRYQNDRLDEPNQTSSLHFPCDP